MTEDDVNRCSCATWSDEMLHHRMHIINGFVVSCGVVPSNAAASCTCKPELSLVVRICR